MKDIDGYEGKYAITKDGRVWAYPRPKGSLGKPHDGLWLKQKISTRGYPTICLRNGEKRGKDLLIHRLVLQTYVGPSNGLTANHINGIKTDNRLENLEWISQMDNIRHARDVLGAYIGKRNGRYVDGRRMKKQVVGVKQLIAERKE